MAGAGDQRAIDEFIDKDAVAGQQCVVHDRAGNGERLEKEDPEKRRDNNDADDEFGKLEGHDLEVAGGAGVLACLVKSAHAIPVPLSY